MDSTSAAKSGSQKTKKGYEDVKQGIKQLYPAEDSKTTSNVDIVFVPGLGADPIASWKSNTSDFNWSSDKNGLQKDFPNARILLYQYESAFQGPLKVENFIDNIARGLLHALQGKREVRRRETAKEGAAKASSTTSYFHRPIVFIGHSMGGLVVAKAVTLMDALRTTFPKMLEATAGCVFFGSPFRGAQAASVALLFARVGEKFGAATTSKLLELMRPEDASLMELRSEFLRLVNDLGTKIGLFCFWEEQDVDVGKMGAEVLRKSTGASAAVAASVSGGFFSLFKKAVGPLKVVERDSATFGDVGVPNLGLSCNHRDLVRFASFRDERYELVREPLRRIIAEAPLNAKNRLNSTRDIDLDAIRNLTDVLGGDSVTQKRNQLQQRFAASSWIPTEAEFLAWLSTDAVTDEEAAPETKHGDCLYICGGEGRGKTGSTIAALQQVEKLIRIDSEKNSGKAPILLVYFFCDPVSEPTAEDLLKSLVLQLISKQYLFASYAKQFTKRENKKAVSLSVENLWQCLQDMLTDSTASSMIYFVINNLHVLPEDSASTKKLLELIKDELETMNNDGDKRSAVRWMFTSRAAKINIEESIRSADIHLIDLEDDKYANQVQLELRRHARDKVMALEAEKKYKKDLAYFVSSLIGQRAQTTGWIDLTCIQLQELPDTESAVKVRQTLKSLPQSLDDMLDEAWEQIFKSEKRADDIKEMLRCLVMTYEDPTLEELAVLAGLPPDEPGADELRELIAKCPSFLVLRGKGIEAKVCFKNDILKPHLLRNINKLLGLSNDEIRWQHGELALRSFEHLVEKFDVDVPVPAESGDDGARDEESSEGESEEDNEENDEDDEEENGEEDEDEEKEDEDEDDEDDASDSSSTLAEGPAITALPYTVKHWLHHASKATAELAEDISRFESFWKTKSRIRLNWLKQYDYLTAAFSNLQCDDELTALHVAASIGYKQLVSSLIKNGYETELNVSDGLANTPLHLAAYFGRPNIVEELVFRGCKVDQGIESGDATPLCMAASRGNIKVMTMLLDGKANPSAVDDWQGCVLNSSIDSGNLEAVKLLVERGAALTYDPDKSGSPLSQAAGQPDRAIFDYLIGVGGDTFEPHDYGKALDAAADAGNAEVFTDLLEHEQEQNALQDALFSAYYDNNWNIVTILLDKHAGLDVDGTFRELATATEDQDELLQKVWAYADGSIDADVVNDCLYEATDKEKESTVSILLDACEADPNAALGDEYGNALTAAAYDGTVNIVKLLLDHGADPNSEHGWPLQIAAAAGHKDVVELLLEHGADVNDNTTNGEFAEGTALQAAVEAGQVDMVELLLSSGADVNLGAGDLAPPIYAATEKAESEILKLLVSHGAELNILGGAEQSTPLIGAAMYMHKSDLKVLVDANADINMPDVDGDTALIIAAVCGEADSVEFLLENGADVLPVSKTRGINALQAALEADNRRCLELMINHVSELLKDAKVKKTISKGTVGGRSKAKGRRDAGEEEGEAESDGEREVDEDDERNDEQEEEE